MCPRIFPDFSDFVEMQFRKSGDFVRVPEIFHCQYPEPATTITSTLTTILNYEITTSSMLENLRLHNHKGIKRIELSKLGHINVFCGKNNSGKTALLEAIQDPSKRSTGRKLTPEGIDKLRGRFRPLANRYSTPHPSQSIHWFEGELPSLKDEIIYQDVCAELGKRFGEEYRKATSHASSTFDFQELFKQFCSQPFDSLLISP